MFRIRYPRHVYSLLGALALLATLVHVVAAAAAASSGITVSGNAFLMDGMPWVPNGFTLVGYVAPKGHARGPAYRNARKLQGERLLGQARGLGANTLRFQVSQPGLDPESPIYDAKYLEEIIHAVREARDKQFAVVLSMQWQRPSGLAGQSKMPSRSTLRAWQQLAPAFANDSFVMLELFNEPGMWDRNPKAWQEWCRGMQTLVDEVRRKGARNVLILDGLKFSHVLAGAPQIDDPLHQLAYAVHPYINKDTDGPDKWRRQWGDFARSHPVLITEWNATSKLAHCQPGAPAISRELIEYVRDRHIGLILWALDLRSTVLDDNGPIGFRDFKCGRSGAGAAQMAVEYFHSHHRIHDRYSHANKYPDLILRILGLR
jgi:endoglucanase